MTCKCQKCGKLMDEKQFYKYRNGTPVELCKKCLTMHVDPFNPDTFVWILKKMDVPYIEQEWNSARNNALAKDPTKVNGTSLVGKYLAKMHLAQWNKYRWADTEGLEESAEKKKIAQELEREKSDLELKAQFERGEISEAEYKTLVSSQTLYENAFSSNPITERVAPLQPRPQMNKSGIESELDSELTIDLDSNGDTYMPTAEVIGENNPFNEEKLISQDVLPDVTAELTADDKIYLAMKWGRTYQPSDWVELEKKYREMTASFDIQDSDTTGTLILICKTYLKMNQAIKEENRSPLNFVNLIRGVA